MLERALGAGVVDINEVIVEQVQTPITLAGVLNGVELKDSERRSVLAADAMQVPIEMKGLLVGADIFLRDGIFRANEVLGFDRDQAVGARDAVRTDPEYEIPWIQFNQLREENFAEVAIYKRARASSEEIAQELNIGVEDVDRAMQVLNGYGIFEHRRSQEVMHFHLRRRVAEIDRIRQRYGFPSLSLAELGARVNRTPRTVSDLRAENREMGEVSTLGQKGIKARGREIRDAILQNPTHGNAMILRLLEFAEESGITVDAIKHQRGILINQGLLERKREVVNRGKTVASMTARREAIVSIFYEALKQANLRNESVVVAEIKKSIEGLSDVSDHTLLHYYHRLESKEKVPPLKLNRTRRDKRNK